MNEKKVMADTIAWMSPAGEKLHSKMTNLEETLEGFQATEVPEEKKPVIKICQTYLEKARGFMQRPLLSTKPPFFGRRHPHLVWELLHRVDECFILLVKDEELYSRAIDVKVSFELNIKEEKIREEWIGPKGRLEEVFEEIKNKKNLNENRYVIRDALKLVNDQMDRNYWQLSMNTLTSVLSGTILGILMLIAWKIQLEGDLRSLGGQNSQNSFATLVALGLMGSYLSNLMTKEDFLYIRGGPYWRYLLHNLLSKPLMSAFAAIFIFILEKSKIIFSINPITTNETAPQVASQLISFNVNPDSVGYVYAVMAIVSAFAADKILRSMIDNVLKRLEQKADKATDSEKKL